MWIGPEMSRPVRVSGPAPSLNPRFTVSRVICMARSIRPGEKGCNDVLAVGIHGNIGAVEDSLILQGKGEVVWQWLGDLAEDILFYVPACGQFPRMIQKNALGMVVCPPVYFVVESEAELIPGEHNLPSYLKSIS